MSMLTRKGFCYVKCLCNHKDHCSNSLRVMILIKKHCVMTMNNVYIVHLHCFLLFYIATAGFTHSAFAFGYEGGINKCTIDGNLVPPGALVRFVQKGLQYLEMEVIQ